MCGPHGIDSDSGLICDCEDGYKTIDYTHKILCTEDSLVIRIPIDKLKKTDRVIVGFDVLCEYDLSSWGFLGKFITELKNLIMDPIILSLLITMMVTFVIALFAKMLK